MMIVTTRSSGRVNPASLRSEGIGARAASCGPVFERIGISRAEPEPRARHMPAIPADSAFQSAVRAVVVDCLGVGEGEEVLVIADPASEELGEALREAAAAAGGDAVLTLMDERPTHGSEPPGPVAAALTAADVFIAPTTKSLSHTQARKRATDAGVRGATLPGVTADMLARVMAVDFPALRERSRAVAARLSAADEARITCPLGTDLHIDLSNREAIAD